jgi:hypothetical protein
VSRAHKLFSRQLAERLQQALITNHTGVSPKLLQLFFGLNQGTFFSIFHETQVKQGGGWQG